MSLDVHSAQCPAKQNQHHGTLGTARLGDLVPYRIAAIALQECGATLDDTRRRAFANEKQVRERSLPAPLIDSPLGNAALAQVLAGKSGVREGAHLAHRVTPKATQRRVGRGVPMRSGRDADGHTAREPVDYAAAQRHQQQLGVLADKDGRLPFDQVAPENVVGPLLVAWHERYIRRVAKIIVATRRRHEQLIGLVCDLAH